MKYDVFISYSRKDYVDSNKEVIPGNLISQIKKIFDDNGITYWFDEDGIFSGDAFAPVLARNIKSSSIFLFISSENSNASEWTSNEIATAHAYKKKIIPFRYDDSAYNESVIMYIAKLDYIEYYTNKSGSFGRLLSSVKSFLEKEREEQEKHEIQLKEEKTRQQNIEELELCNEKLEQLNLQKNEIECEILIKEKEIIDLQKLLQTVDLQINGLNDKKKLLSELITTIAVDIDGRNQQRSALYTELTEVCKAFMQRCWILNILESLFLLFFMSVGLMSLLMAVTSNKDSAIFVSITALAYIGFVGMYRLIKNCRDCLYWLLPYFMVLIILAPFMFIRKHNFSGWNLLQKSPKSLKDDMVYILMIFTLIIGVLGLMAVYLIL